MLLCDRPMIDHQPARPLLLPLFISLFLLLATTACQPIQRPTPITEKGSATGTIVPAATDTEISSIRENSAIQQAQLLEPTGFIQRIHDPVMAKEGDTYYVFSTGSRIIVICSKDMLDWQWCGRVFERNPAWLSEVVPGVMDLWAPDISYFNGKWHLYYSGSTFGSNRSVIALATNVTLDPDSPTYNWVDEGEVIRSRPTNNWNAIDPNLTFDTTGQPWLVFGSYWSGIKLRKLDLTTGKPATDDETLYSLAQRFNNSGAIEAPFLIHRQGYYYLFASFDSCCRGVDSTYNVRVGRSLEITGPYLDRQEIPLLEGGGTLLLRAYGQWRGPGHNGFYSEDGLDYIVYHAYDAKQVGIPKLRIEQLGWDEDGWPYLASQVGE